MKTQRVKTENFDLIREISNLRRQVREFVQISVFTQPTFIQSAAVIVSGYYRLRGINPKEALDGINPDAYSSWAYAVKGKC
jgi:hypothetical protein